jgi:hypothetical protein
LSLAKPVRVSKKFCLLDVAASSHGPHTVGTTSTRAARVPTFNNLSDDSLLDVCKTPSPKKMVEKHASALPSVSGEICILASLCCYGPHDCFAETTRLVPLLDLLLENLDEDLEYCLRRVSFVLLSHFGIVVLILIDYFISQALTLSRKQCEKRAMESAQMAKIAELEVVTRSQANNR